jgi:Tol biopolymer transport system component
MEIFVGGPDGSGARALTHNGKANFAPYFLPDNRHVIYASNAEGGGRNFDLYLVDSEGPTDQAPVRVTHSPVFESFPMFSPDGRQLVFSSNRNAKKPGDTNLFIGQWIGDVAPPPAAAASPD